MRERGQPQNPSLSAKAEHVDGSCGLATASTKPGEVTERPKVHDWKSCVRATVPRVRAELESSTKWKIPMRTTVLAKQGAPEGRSAPECNVQRSGTLHGGRRCSRSEQRAKRVVNPSLSADNIFCCDGTWTRGIPVPVTATEPVTGTGTATATEPASDSVTAPAPEPATAAEPATATVVSGTCN